MTDQAHFTLSFPKFSGEPVTASFSAGINIIYGESGVGKSNLIRQLLDIPALGENNFLLVSKSIPPSTQVIFQNPDNQIVASTIARELAFSIECVENNHRILEKRIRASRQMLPATIASDRHPATLSGGEKELLNIINAIATKPDAILIDDGLSFLSEKWKESIIIELNNLVTDNNTVIIWFTSEITDCAYGKNTWELDLSDISQLRYKKRLMTESIGIKPGLMNIDISGMSYNYNGGAEVFKSMSKEYTGLRSLGIAGINGSGKTTLAKLLIGLYEPLFGHCEIKIDGNDNPLVGYLDQFPERMFGSGTLNQLAADLIDNGMLDQDRFMQCQRRISDFQIDWQNIGDRSVSTISWSALRFAVIFLMVHCNYDIIVLDEPTFGLGWHQRRKLVRFLGEYLNHNYLILISHDHEIISSLCDGVISLEENVNGGRRETVLEKNDFLNTDT